MKIICQPNSCVTLQFETSMLVKLFPSIFVQPMSTLDKLIMHYLPENIRKHINFLYPSVVLFYEINF